MKIFTKILAVILSIVIVILGIGIFPSFSVKKAESENGSSWMSSVDDNKFLTNLNIPGTHDSAAKFTAAGAISTCQGLSFDEQLDIGVRFFDIRLKHEVDKDFSLVHGVANCFNPEKPFSVLNVQEILNSMYKFLDKNPSETILFCIKEDNGNAGDKFFDEFSSRYINEKWFIENRIPTMGEARGKIVLLRRCSVNSEKYNDTNSGINLSTWPDQGAKELEHISFDTEPFSSNVLPVTVNIQDRYNLNKKTKVESVVQFFNAQTSAGNLNLNYLSTANGYCPYINAIYINNKAKDFDYKSYNKNLVVLFDFVNAELSEQVFQSNFI